MKRPTSRLATGVLLIASLLVLSYGAAVSYRVLDAGGPDDLAERVAAAFAAWTSDVETLDAVPDDTADVTFRYGDPSLFGPDTVTLTVVRTDAAARTYEVLVNPERPDATDRALLHETGLVLGLPAGASPALERALAPDDVAALVAADREALLANVDAVPADINRDGVVDFYDLLELAREYGRTGVNLAADIDGDGRVDDADLALLREAYAFGEPSETPPQAAAAAAGTGAPAAPGAPLDPALEEAEPGDGDVLDPAERDGFEDADPDDDVLEDEAEEDDPFGDPDSDVFEDFDDADD